MKKVLVVMGLLAFLVSLGCSQQVFFQQVDYSNILDCNNQQNSVESRACSLISADPDRLGQCEGSYLEHAFFCIAFLKNDNKVCENIKTSAYYLCRAYTENNPKLCDKNKADYARDDCYLDLGMNLRDKELCNKVLDEQKKGSCLAVTDLDLERCFDYEAGKYACVKNVLEFSNGKVSCDDLSGNRLDDCLEIAGGP